MKAITISAAALLVAMSASAQAEGLGLKFAGEVAYSLESESFVAEVGPSLNMYGLSIDPRMHTALSGTDPSFTGTSVELGYGLSESLSAFGKVSTDEDLSYEDLSVGVRFSF